MSYIWLTVPVVRCRVKVKVSVSTQWRHVEGNRGVTPFTPNLNGRWGWVVRQFTPKKGQWYEWNRRLGGPQSRSGKVLEDRNKLLRMQLTNQTSDSAEFYVLLTVPVWSCKLVQLDAQFCLIYLFLLSTCFGHPCAHHREKIAVLCDTGTCHSERR